VGWMYTHQATGTENVEGRKEHQKVGSQKVTRSASEGSPGVLQNQPDAHVRREKRKNSLNVKHTCVFLIKSIT